MMPAPDDGQIVYEQPLSERIRIFLRLEFLFHHAHHLLEQMLEQNNPWASRSTVEVIIDIMAVLSRADFKQEIIKELDRHVITLNSLGRHPNVDQERRSEVLGKVRATLQDLHQCDTTPGYHLRYNDLLSAVRQRSSIPAGTCDFDLPAFHYWLECPGQQRLQDLQDWLSAFELLDASIGLCLELIRESAVSSHETACGGFFQNTLGSSMPCQLLRIALPRERLLYPEISAGKHRFSVRFCRPGGKKSRPDPTDEDIDFILHRCVI